MKLKSAIEKCNTYKINLTKWTEETKIALLNHVTKCYDESVLENPSKEEISKAKLALKNLLSKIIGDTDAEKMY